MVSDLFENHNFHPSYYDFIWLEPATPHVSTQHHVKRAGPQPSEDEEVSATGRGCYGNLHGARRFPSYVANVPLQVTGIPQVSAKNVNGVGLRPTASLWLACWRPIPFTRRDKKRPKSFYSSYKHKL